MPFDLQQHDIDTVIQTLQGFPEIESALIFGSRAKGKAQPGSDIDLALKGDRVTDEIVTQLKIALEELPIPYFFDVVGYKSIQNKDLRRHIDRVGKRIYTPHTQTE